MIRKLATLLSVMCVATVCTALLALGLMWFRGQLSTEVIDGITALLRGEEPNTIADGEGPSRPDPSADDIVERRVRKLLDIENREKEIDLLLAMVNERADAVEAGQADLATRTKAFDDRLAALEELWQSDATTQAQAVLKAQQPADAVAHLAPLELDKAVLLVRGLPDKTIARILQQFARSNDEKELQRGREIFEAITRAEPRRTLLEETTAAGGVDDDAPMAAIGESADAPVP